MNIPCGAKSTILIDAREFVPNRLTGIGRVLIGLIDAIVESDLVAKVVLAAASDEIVPAKLKNRKNIHVQLIQGSFLKSEKIISSLTKESASLFISPYPKLPLFGCHCKSIHIVHDVLYLTHPAYKKRYRTFFDEYRLKTALKSSALTWYDSLWSLNETRKLTGFTGRNPRVRYPGIDDRFVPAKNQADEATLKPYSLPSGNYILVVGNGLPHKNIGVLLDIGKRLDKPFVFVGMPRQNMAFWQTAYPAGNAVYIEHVPDEDMPAVFRGAYCLAQPSTAEGYGYPPLEAMACGIPAVVSDIPVLHETTGGAALVADPDKAETWLDAFLVLENYPTYQNQIDKGLKWVESFRGVNGWGKYISDIQMLIRGQ
ncbi:MAG: glycosyltransferase family 1 protein [Thermodesulfobacteriota bacterium]